MWIKIKKIEKLTNKQTDKQTNKQTKITPNTMYIHMFNINKYKNKTKRYIV